MPCPVTSAETEIVSPGVTLVDSMLSRSMVGGSCSSVAPGPQAGVPSASRTPRPTNEVERVAVFKFVLMIRGASRGRPSAGSICSDTLRPPVRVPSVR